MSYSVAFREEIIRKVLSSDRTDSILKIADNVGLPTRTIRRWVNRYSQAIKANTAFAKYDRITAVLLTINLPFENKSIFCRKHGFMPEELEEWELELKNVLKTGAISALDYAKVNQEKDELRRQLNAKEKELERKDKALAEAATLLLLQKKVQDLLVVEDEKLNQN